MCMIVNQEFIVFFFYLCTMNKYRLAFHLKPSLYVMAECPDVRVRNEPCLSVFPI